MTNTKTCPVCNNDTMKTGKLQGISALQSLDARTGLGGSDVHMTFCATCGEVTGIKVAQPDKIK